MELWAVLKNSLPKNRDEKKLFGFLKAIYDKLKAEEEVAHQEDIADNNVANTNNLKRARIANSIIEQATNIVKASNALESEIAWRDKKWRQLFKEFALLHQEGLELPDEETTETKDLVKTKMKLWDEIVELQNQITYIQEHNELPTAKPKVADKTDLPESDVEKMKMLSNLKDAISKAKGRLAKNEAEFAKEKDRKKLKSLSEKMSLQRQNIETKEAQRKALKEYFDVKD
jgi:hypothetical protein